MARMRRLVLHMGLPKTGTSALQTWLASNRTWLGRQGVLYPGRAPRPGQTGRIGNGAPLLRYLRPEPGDPPEDAVRVLEKVLAVLGESDAHSVVYSNEWLLAQHRTDRLAAFREVLSQAGVQLHAVVYVRDLAGHAVSAYAQSVQSRLSTATLGEFTGSVGHAPHAFSVRLREHLSRVSEVVGADRLVVRHFESQRASLIPDFLSVALGVTADPTETVDVSSVSNRTLTLREIEWKRYLNSRITTREQSYRLGAALAALPPEDGEPELAPTRADVAALRRFDDQVDWVNRTFFGGEPLLSVQGTVTCTPAPQQPLALTAHERRLLDAMVALHS